MASVMIEMDLPDAVEVTGYERHGEGHGFEVTWPWPARPGFVSVAAKTSRCDRNTRTRVQVVRDLDLWGQPSFWIYQVVYQRCSRCHHRQHLLAPFKRKDVTYTYRFEKHVLQMLVGSNEEEVAARLGISAETVALIVRNQLGEPSQVGPQAGPYRRGHR